MGNDRSGNQYNYICFSFKSSNQFITDIRQASANCSHNLFEDITLCFISYETDLVYLSLSYNPDFILCL